MSIYAENAFNEWNKTQYMGTSDVVKGAFLLGFLYAQTPESQALPKDALTPVKVNGCGNCVYYQCDNGCVDKQ